MPRQAMGMCMSVVCVCAYFMCVCVHVFTALQMDAQASHECVNENICLVYGVYMGFICMCVCVEILTVACMPRQAMDMCMCAEERRFAYMDVERFPSDSTFHTFRKNVVYTRLAVRACEVPHSHNNWMCAVLDKVFSRSLAVCSYPLPLCRSNSGVWVHAS